jgi:hypothetical protein
MKMENTTIVASQKPRSKPDAITPATPNPTPARPTSHWKRLVGQPMDSATRAGMNRWPLPSTMPLTPTSHVRPSSSVVTFQSSTPRSKAITRLTRNPASGR